MYGIQISEIRVVDPDQTFLFNVYRDPDPAPHQSVAMTTGLQTLHGAILSLHTPIVSVHGPPWLHFEPIPVQHLNFNFPKYADPDPHPCRKLMFLSSDHVLLFRGRAASGVWGGRTHESASGLRQNKWMAFISSKILWTLLRFLQKLLCAVLLYLLFCVPIPYYIYIIQLK